jgi:hypothetical protein
VALRRAQAQATGDSVDVAVHRLLIAENAKVAKGPFFALYEFFAANVPDFFLPEIRHGFPPAA